MNRRILAAGLLVVLLGTGVGVALRKSGLGANNDIPANQIDPPIVVNASSADKQQAISQLLAKPYKDLKGHPTSLKQYAGKILVINFWASWCAPCRVEMPDFSLLSQTYAAKGVQFVGIALDDIKDVQDFLKTSPVSYPIAIGTLNTLDILIPLGNPSGGMPFTLIVDGKGQLRDTHLGKMDKLQLENRLAKLMAK